MQIDYGYSVIAGQGNIGAGSVGNDEYTAGTLSQLGTPIETYTATACEFRLQLDTPRGTVSL